MDAVDMAAEKIQMDIDIEALKLWITALATLAEDYEATTRLEMDADRFVRASITNIQCPDQGVVYHDEAEFLAACGLAADPATARRSLHLLVVSPLGILKKTLRQNWSPLVVPEYLFHQRMCEFDGGTVSMNGFEFAEFCRSCNELRQSITVSI